MAIDYYEILQVHPRADGEAITAAYQRLRALYDPARLAGVADELVELARQKRDMIERAYSVLGDAQRRAAYDRDLASSALASTPPDVADGTDDGAVLDYRPLPPARRQERAKEFSARPVQAPPRGRAERGRATGAKLPAWIGPAAIVGMFLLLFPVSLLLTNGGGPAATVQTPTQTPSPYDIYEETIQTAKAATESDAKNAKVWIDYGNMLYDSAQIVREKDPGGTLYQQRLPRWLEASESYRKALALDPNHPDRVSIQADLGASECYYGFGTGDQTIVRHGLEETRKAVAAAASNTRALLSLGNCLVSVQPPQSQDAIKSWQRVIDIEPPDSQIAAQARQLIARYQ